MDIIRETATIPTNTENDGEISLDDDNSDDKNEDSDDNNNGETQNGEDFHKQLNRKPLLPAPVAPGCRKLLLKYLTVILLRKKGRTLEEECPQVLSRVAKEEIKNAASGAGGGSRKLKPEALSLYVGNGQREAVEAIGNFDLSLPRGLVIVLNNCHYAIHYLVELIFSLRL
ncbi:hypothetical protein Tco_1576029 [Tanacetum coccineum]